MGYKWPKKTAKPTLATTHINILLCSANHTGIQPLNASPSKVKIAGNFLPLRAILVAPMLPLPTVRGSGRPKSLLKIMPNEMEPIRYAATIQTIGIRVTGIKPNSFIKSSKYVIPLHPSFRRKSESSDFIMQGSNYW